MNPDGGRPREIHAQFAAQFEGFGIEIVDHFHVVGEKPDWGENDLGLAAGVQFADVLQYVGFEPRLRRRSAAALINESSVAPNLLRDELAGFLQLREVWAAARRADRREARPARRGCDRTWRE